MKVHLSVLYLQTEKLLLKQNLHLHDSSIPSNCSPAQVNLQDGRLFDSDCFCLEFVG